MTLLLDYELAEPTIRKLFDSKLRLAIVDALAEKPMPLSDLRRVVGANAPNTSSKAKDLEEMGIVERNRGQYGLTPYGRAVLHKSKQSFEFYATYEKFKEFWETRHLEGIPQELLLRLADLKESTLMRSSLTDVNKPHDDFVKMLYSLKERFFGLTPVYHSDYLNALILKVQEGLETNLILTSDILSVFTKLPDDLRESLKKQSSALNLWVYPSNPHIGFMIGDDFMTLGLEPKDKTTHFIDMAVYSTHPNAIAWCLDLLEYYKIRSKPVNLGAYL